MGGLGAERTRQLEPRGDRVNREHVLRSLGERRLDRTESDRPETEYRDRRAGDDAGLDHRVVTGPHHIAGEQRDVVGHPGRDPAQGQVGVWNEEQLCLSSLKSAERRAVAEHTAVVAFVEIAACAEEAIAAGGAVGAENAVALGHRADTLAGRDHRADVLVSDREPLLDRDPAVVDVEVGAADSARLDPDDRVAGGVELRLGDVVDPDLAGRLEGHRSHAAGL